MRDLAIARIGNDRGREERRRFMLSDARQKGREPAGKRISRHELAHQLGFGQRG